MTASTSTPSTKLTSCTLKKFSLNSHKKLNFYLSNDMQSIYNFYSMGSDKSKFETINKIDPNEWKPVGSENGAEIVKSNRGYGEGEIRIISLDPKRTVDEEM